MTVGGVLAGGLGVELIKSYTTDDFRVFSAVLPYCLTAVALLLIGLWWRARERRRFKVGVAVLAHDSEGSSSGESAFHSALNHFQNTSALTMEVRIDRSAGDPWDPDQIDALANEVEHSRALSKALAPDITRLNLHVTMPLHVAFRFGSQFRPNLGPPITILAPKPNSAAGTYFTATSLSEPDTKLKSPLTIEDQVVFEDGDPRYAALALDLQGLGEDFSAPVHDECRKRGIRTLLVLRYPHKQLDTNYATFAGVVEQTINAWRGMTLPPEARTGHHFIFLSGPAPIAVALGTHLAGPARNSWTALSLKRRQKTYEAIPDHPLE